MIKDLCDAIVAELNEGNFTEEFTAVRAYVPKYDMEELATLQVSVLPSSWTREDSSRADVQNTLVAQIGVQKKIASDTDADDLVALVEEIVEYIQDRELTAFASAQFISASVDPIYDAVIIDTHRVFISVISLTYYTI